MDYGRRISCCWYTVSQVGKHHHFRNQDGCTSGEMIRERLSQILGAPHRKLDHRVMCLAVYYRLLCTYNCVHVALQHNTAQQETDRRPFVGMLASTGPVCEACERVPCGGGDTHDGLLLRS